jgi:hypothetical protein
MTIQARRRRFPIICLIGALFAVFLAVLIIDVIRNFNQNMYNNFLYLLMFTGLLFWALAFSLAAFLDFIRPRLSPSAVLTITDQGIDDNLSIFSAGEILWVDVTDIKIVTRLGTNFLIIGVKNPDEVIARKMKLLQLPLKSFLKKFGSPVFISQRKLGYDLTALKELLLETKNK